MLQRRIQRRWAFGHPPNKLSQAHDNDDLEAAWGIPLSAGLIQGAHLLLEGDDNLELVHLAWESGKP